jgi:hypothetical protein
MSQSDIAEEVGQLADDRAMLIDWVLERLDDLKQSLAEIEEGIDPPHQPPRGFDVPFGGDSALEGIAAAIFKAEDRWSQ